MKARLRANSGGPFDAKSWAKVPVNMNVKMDLSFFIRRAQIAQSSPKDLPHFDDVPFDAQ